MVYVVLVDLASGKTISESDLLEDQLPETFELATTLGVGGEQWEVERAVPMTRAEYKKSQQLRLELRKVVKADPKAMQFSLPTIENTQPALNPGDLANALSIHEDVWRQIELVARRFQPEIAAERSVIHAVIAERSGPGFTRIHVRERIPEPLAGVDLELASLYSAAELRPLAIGTLLVAGGFAYGDTIYGCAVDGVVTALCAVSDPAVLRPIAVKRDLLVVDWCRG
ncbi:MAG TPA: hypothetical protein VF403_05260 [Kofleriaceae bacterium]